MADALLGAGWLGEPVADGLGAFDPGTVATWADAAEPVNDLDGDGTPDTVVLDTAAYGAAGAHGPHALVVAADTDDDGDVDRLTAVADDGEFGVWEFRRDDDGSARWIRIDGGNLGMDESHTVDHE